MAFSKKLILAHFEIDYSKAICYDDKIIVYTKCSRLSTKSFDLSWKIVKSVNSYEKEEIVADGKAIIACYDHE